MDPVSRIGAQRPISDHGSAARSAAPSWIGATRHILHHASWILSLGSAQRAIILFPTFAEYNGLPADLLKQEFISYGRGYSVIRVEPRNPKYPILARGLLDNLVYKFSVDQVKEALERKKKV